MRDLRELKINKGGMPVVTPAPTPQQLAKVEQLVGTKLPEAYVQLLMFANGGYPELDSFQFGVNGETWDIGINRFLSISSDTDSTEDVVWNYSHLWPGAPHKRWILPIANDGGGNLICLDLSAEAYGEVVLMFHDPSDSPLIRTGLSFEQMLNALTTDPDYI